MLQHLASQRKFYIFNSIIIKLNVWMTIAEWVECMGVASACREQEVGVASGSGWNLWVWL